MKKIVEIIGIIVFFLIIIVSFTIKVRKSAQEGAKNYAIEQAINK